MSSFTKISKLFASSRRSWSAMKGREAERSQELSRSWLRRRLQLEGLESRQLMAAEIFGTVYEDVDRSGTKTGPDNGLSGWTVFLDLNHDSSLNVGEPSSVSNVDGDYSIAGLAGGSYRVMEIPPSGWTPVTPTSKDVTVETNKKIRADFFNFGGGNIIGTVWSDIDHDGQRTIDPVTGEFTDPALHGWTIFLDLNTNELLDAGEPSTLTDVQGVYEFRDLAPGDYEVTEILPVGWEATKQHDTKETAAVVALETTVLDFGNYSQTNGGIQGAVFNDLNADGDRNVDASTGEYIEPGLEGWTVFIDLNRNEVLDDTDLVATTDSDGEYAFASLDAGDYEVIEVLMDGWVASPGRDIKQTVGVFGGEVSTALDFANFTSMNGSITGLVWNDVNRNGVRDYDTLSGTYLDPALTGWTVYVDLNRNRFIDSGEPVASTDAEGRYVFLDLQIGEYELEQVLPPGWEVAPTFSDNQSVQVYSGAQTVASDFANYDASAASPGSVSGTVWNDLNGNGTLDFSESGLAGWTVFLDQNNNGLLDGGELNMVTDSSGAYTFTSLAAGTITIGVEMQNGWRATYPLANSQTLLLRSGQEVTDVSFGEIQLNEASISGVVFADTNKNGSRESSEVGLAGMTVYLDLNNSNTLDLGEPSVLTSQDLYYTPDVDEAGDYSFTHLALGTYVVRTILTERLSETPASELVHTVTISGFENRTGVNTAAVYRSTEIRGVKFEDSNGNHLRDPEEPGMPGATVFVDLDRDDMLDDSEPRATTAEDGSYSFIGLPSGSYVVRSIVEAGHTKSSPSTTGGILWPTGASHPAVGNVSPSSIVASLSNGQSYNQTISITLPDTGALTDVVDVFLLFDDTGSFTYNSPIVRSAFPEIISRLQTALPGTDLGYGVGRFEEYGNFAFEYDSGRPFILNQPIVASSTPGYMESIQSALNRTTPGYGGDGPETDIEALYQLVTGKGFDGDNNGSVLDSGPAGLASTQLNPGASGDVPSFASFTADPTQGVLPAAGNIGGAGFRSGALPIILLATDIGLAYQPKGEATITGAGGLSIPISDLTQVSRDTTPFNSGAGIQETVTGLNALGALVIGLGTNPDSNIDPRQQLEALSKLTGAVNQSTSSIPNGTANPIDPGDPLYFQIASGFGISVADGVVNAIQNAATNVAVDIEVRASDPRVRLINHSGMAHAIGSGMTASFDIEIIGDGAPRLFDIQFVRAGTNVVLGSIPVTIGTPITGNCYHFDELEDGEVEIDDDFGDITSVVSPANVAPSFIKGSDVIDVEDSGSHTITNWATSISAGPASESGQVLNFIVITDNQGLFSVAPSLSSDGTLTFTPAENASGEAIVSVQLHDDGGTANGGSDTSVTQLLTITITPVNDAPQPLLTLPDLTVGENAASSTIPLAGAFSDIEDSEVTLMASTSNPALIVAEVSGTTLTLVYAPDSNGIAEVTITGTDSGGLVATIKFQVTVGNSLPTLEAVGPADGFSGVSGQSRVVRLTASDVTDNGERPFNYEVNWGDGTPVESHSSGSSLDLSHVYDSSGSYSAQFRVIDPDGGASGWETLPFGILNSELQGNVWAFGGHTDDDTFVITPNTATPEVSIQQNGVLLGTFAIPSGGLRFFGGLGNDSLTSVGSTGDDLFAVDGSRIVLSGTTLPLSMQVDGSGLESMIIKALSGDDSVTILSGSATVDGGAGVDQLIGSSQVNTWNLTGLGIGTLNTIPFTSIETISGGSHSDDFRFADAGRLTGTIDGGDGIDTLDYGDRVSAVSLNLTTNKATGASGIASLEILKAGVASTDQLTGPNSTNNWRLHADASISLNETFEIIGFEILNGSSSSDTFDMEPGVLSSPVLNGGAGTDFLRYTEYGSAVTVNRSLLSATAVSSFKSIEGFSGSGYDDVFIGANSNTAWTIQTDGSGTFNGGTFSSFESVQGGDANDTFTIAVDSVSRIRGGEGIDTIKGPAIANLWNLDGFKTGRLNLSTSFAEMENLTGSTDADWFAVSVDAGGFGVVNGAAGADKLDYSSWSSPVVVDLASKTAPALTSFASISSVVGSSAVDMLQGANSNTNWSITGSGSGTAGGVSFESFENLHGGTANDSYRITGGMVQSISGGDGTDTLIGPAINNAWVITGTGVGVLNGQVAFSGLENLTGGAAEDEFTIEPLGALLGTLSGGAGLNSLSYSQWVSDVSVNATPGVATGIQLLAANFSMISGGAGNDTLFAFPSLPSILIGNAGDDHLVGSTNGRDLLFGGMGMDTLHGMGGDDILFGGASAFDQSSSALREIHAEWRSSRTYQQRVNNLRGGTITGLPLNGTSYLTNHPTDTLLDDGVADQLFGGTGTDWFIKSPIDSIGDLGTNELVDDPTL